MKKLLVIVLSAIFILSGCAKLGLSDKAKEKAGEVKDGTEYVVFASNGSRSGIYSIDVLAKTNKEVLKSSYQRAKGLENKIIFYSEIDGKKGIYSANPDGKNINLVLGNYSLSDTPVINPDLSGFIFAGDKIGGNKKELYYMKMGSQEPSKLTGIKSDKDTIKYISFFDNNTIFYSKKTKENGKYLSRIFRYSLNENKEEKFFEGKYNYVNPVFSPDKSKMAFICDKSGNYNLYALDISTKEEKLLDNKSPAFGGSVKWSIDGKGIIYKVQNSNKKNSIKYVDISNKAVKDIGEGYIADFSKDGKNVIYASYDSNAKKQVIKKYLVDENKSEVILEFEEPVNKAESINMLYCTNKIDM